MEISADLGRYVALLVASAQIMMEIADNAELSVLRIQIAVMENVLIYRLQIPTVVLAAFPAL